jgi:hypothetical protein
MPRFILIPILYSLIFFTVYAQNSPDNELRRIVAGRGQAEVTISVQGNDPSIITKHVSIASIRNGLISIKLSPLTVDWFISQISVTRLSPAELLVTRFRVRQKEPCNGILIPLTFNMIPL